MTDRNAIAARRANGGPRGYVDNYDRMSPGMHPRARAAMDPMVDTLERSQLLRGGYEGDQRPESIDDAMDFLLDMVKERGRVPPGFLQRGANLGQSEFGQLIAEASRVAATDGELATVVRAAKTLRLPDPFENDFRPHGGDPVFGGARPKQYGPSQTEEGEPETLRPRTRRGPFNP